MKFLVRFLQFSLLLLILSGFAFLYLKYSAGKSFKENSKNIPYDAIIVPGYPFQEDDSSWHEIMKIRVYWSHYLYETGYTKNVIYSGAAVYSPFVESKIMKAYGIALGIPAEAIYIDTIAKHSTENLYYAYQLAQNLGFEKIALATDPFQNAALALFAKNNDIEVDFLPIVFHILKKLNKVDPEINPTSAYVNDFVALPNKVSYFERLKGTMGKKIDKDVYKNSSSIPKLIDSDKRKQDH